jgi:TrmH family RNA methyltransferase
MRESKPARSDLEVAVELSRTTRSRIRNLHRRKGRERTGSVLVEGRRAAHEVLVSGAPIELAIWSERLLDSDAGSELARLLREGARRALMVDDGSLAELASTETPQGVVLEVKKPHTDLRGIFARPGPILVLDAIQDPGNVGTLIRSAHAFGCAGVVSLGGTADPWGPKAVRAAAGSGFHIAVAQATARDLAHEVRAGDRRLWIAEVDAPDVRRAVTSTQGTRVVLVVGNEGAGIRPELRSTADVRVGIPLPGGAESLNAGVAGSILLYALTRESEWESAGS